VLRCADGWNDDYVIAELLLLQFRPHPTADRSAMYQPALEFQPHPVSEPRTEVLQKPVFHTHNLSVTVIISTSKKTVNCWKSSTERYPRLNLTTVCSVFFCTSHHQNNCCQYKFSHVSTRLLIHLSTHLYYHHHSHHPSLLHSFTPGSKPTFSTNPSHLRLLLPTRHDNGTGPERTCHAHHFIFSFTF